MTTVMLFAMSGKADRGELGGDGIRGNAARVELHLDALGLCAGADVHDARKLPQSGADALLSAVAVDPAVIDEEADLSLHGATLCRVRLAAPYDGDVQLRVLPHGGEPIECHPSGCCLWIGKGAARAARRRLYEASHGPLPAGARLERLCERRRCVNVDHVRVVRAPIAVSRDMQYCSRGHELTPANVVRHRDGRIAYCKTCRNARRRQRYAHDTSFAESERVRQRRIRRLARQH